MKAPAFHSPWYGGGGGCAEGAGWVWPGCWAGGRSACALEVTTTVLGSAAENMNTVGGCGGVLPTSCPPSSDSAPLPEFHALHFFNTLLLSSSSRAAIKPRHVWGVCSGAERVGNKGRAKHTQHIFSPFLSFYTQKIPAAEKTRILDSGGPWRHLDKQQRLGGWVKDKGMEIRSVREKKGTDEVSRRDFPTSGSGRHSESLQKMPEGIFNTQIFGKNSLEVL